MREGAVPEGRTRFAPPCERVLEPRTGDPRRHVPEEGKKADEKLPWHQTLGETCKRSVDVATILVVIVGHVNIRHSLEDCCQENAGIRSD